MIKRIALAGVTAAAAFALAAPAMAQMYDKATIENSTGYTISEIYIAPSKSNDWEEDVLDWDVLKDGQEVSISFRKAANTCDWDLKVVYDDGDEAEWEHLDLCENWHFELFYNARTGDTHLTASN